MSFSATCAAATVAVAQSRYNYSQPDNWEYPGDDMECYLPYTGHKVSMDHASNEAWQMHNMCMDKNVMMILTSCLLAYYLVAIRLKSKRAHKLTIGLQPRPEPIPFCHCIKDHSPRQNNQMKGGRGRGMPYHGRDRDRGVKKPPDGNLRVKNPGLHRRPGRKHLLEHFRFRLGPSAYDRLQIKERTGVVVYDGRPENLMEFKERTHMLVMCRNDDARRELLGQTYMLMPQSDRNIVEKSMSMRTVTYADMNGFNR